MSTSVKLFSAHLTSLVPLLFLPPVDGVQVQVSSHPLWISPDDPVLTVVPSWSEGQLVLLLCKSPLPLLCPRKRLRPETQCLSCYLHQFLKTKPLPTSHLILDKYRQTPKYMSSTPYLTLRFWNKVFMPVSRHYTTSHKLLILTENRPFSGLHIEKG